MYYAKKWLFHLFERRSSWIWGWSGHWIGKYMSKMKSPPTKTYKNMYHMTIRVNYVKSYSFTLSPGGHFEKWGLKPPILNFFKCYLKYSSKVVQDLSKNTGFGGSLGGCRWGLVRWPSICLIIISTIYILEHWIHV